MTRRNVDYKGWSKTALIGAIASGIVGLGVLFPAKNNQNNGEIISRPRIVSSYPEVEFSPILEEIAQEPEVIPQQKPEPELNKYQNVVIMLDPGHGMGNTRNGLYDPGAVKNKIYESNLVLKQAKIVRDKLTERGIQVRLTREDEKTNTSLADRVKLANESDSDFYVSFHINSFTDPSAKGVRVYFYPGSSEGEELGRSVQDNLVKTLTEKVQEFNQDYEGLRPGNFHVIRNTRMPSILVESGFIANPRDIKYLTENADVVAEGIYNGIIEYVNSNLKELSK